MDRAVKAQDFPPPPQKAGSTRVPTQMDLPGYPAEDALGPARGILLATALGLIFWVAIFFLVWLIFFR